MAEAESVLFEERQGWGRPRLWAVALFGLGVAMVAMAAVGMKRHWGWAGAGIIGGVMIGVAIYAQAGLVVRISKGRVVIRAGAGMGMTLGVESVAGWEVCAVLPRVRIGTAGERGEGRVYLMRSLSAVEIKLTDGRAVLIGTRHVTDFVRALERAKQETVRTAAIDAAPSVTSAPAVAPGVV